MTTATAPPPAAPPAPPGPRPKVWTVDQFQYLGDLGVFEGRRAMLIDGVIIEQGPMNPPHAIAATNTEDAVRELFGRGWHVRVSKPLVLGQTTDPEPDVAVLPGRPADYPAHPTSAALVVEISDTSLRYDLGEKMSLYAAAGVTDYWVVDVTGRQLIVHRRPRPDPGQRFGHSYASATPHGPADAVAPLAAPGAAVRVADLLP